MFIHTSILYYMHDIGRSLKLQKTCISTGLFHITVGYNHQEIQIWNINNWKINSFSILKRKSG